MQQQSVDALAGIDLLMNPKKRTSASSDAMSSISSRSRGSSAARGHNGARVIDDEVPAFDATVGVRREHERARDAGSDAYGEDDDDDCDDDDGGGDDFAAPPPRRPAFKPGRRAQPTSRSDDGASEASSGSSGSSASERSGARRRGGASPLSEEEVLEQKRELLYQFDRIEKKGVRLPRRFTMSSPLEEMKAELERIKLDREVDISVKFQRKLLMTCVTGIEFLNGKFDPLDIKLEGWSDSINDNLGDYDDLFEELHIKYRSKAKMAPELKLMFMVGGSGVMFHLTNTMFKSQLPGLDQVMKQNPGLMRQFTKATFDTMARNQAADAPQQQQPPQQRGGGGGGGGLFGMLGGMFGGSGGGPASFVQPPAPPAPGFMKGPKHVDEILREMQHNAFSPPSRGQAVAQSSRIEVVSNASESDISELPDDDVSALLGGGGAATQPAAATKPRAPRKPRVKRAVDI